MNRLKAKVAKLEERRIAVEGSLEDAVAELRSKKILVKKLTDHVDDLIDRVENLEGRSEDAVRTERAMGIVRGSQDVASRSNREESRRRDEREAVTPASSRSIEENRGGSTRPRLDYTDEVHTRRRKAPTKNVHFA